MQLKNSSKAAHPAFLRAMRGPRTQLVAAFTNWLATLNASVSIDKKLAIRSLLLW
jgi:hypothetical protein